MTCQQGSGKRWELHLESHAASTPSAGAKTPQGQTRQRLEETQLAQRLGAMRAVLDESQSQRANGHERRLDILAASPVGSKPASQLGLRQASKATTSPAQAQSPVLSPSVPSPAQDPPAAKQMRRLVPCLPIIGVAGSHKRKAVAQTVLPPKKQESVASISISGDRSVFSFL